MGKLFDEIDDKLASWIRAQALFFVATAPSDGGHVNVSPKGPIESLSIVDGRTVEYEDHIGSGAETAAHIRENGRVCVMLCAFTGPPRIVRLHGTGEVVPLGDPGADGVRAVIRVRLDRISDSCGFGVPLMDFVGERTQRERWLESKGPEALREYVHDRNSASIDGLPAFDAEAVTAD
jgi:Pyridoxamine 5'-phosphate oxidase